MQKIVMLVPLSLPRVFLPYAVSDGKSYVDCAPCYFVERWKWVEVARSHGCNHWFGNFRTVVQDQGDEAPAKRWHWFVYKSMLFLLKIAGTSPMVQFFMFESIIQVSSGFLTIFQYSYNGGSLFTYSLDCKARCVLSPLWSCWWYVEFLPM